MSVEDRLDRIERRLASLEAVLREARPLTTPLTPALDRGPRAEESALVSSSPARAEPAPRPVRPPPVAPATKDLGGAEQWIGQRGLLAVGVVLLILAAAYTLKLAFDRGWISPAMRCVGAGVVGLAVGGIGWRLYHRGLKAYGASLIGAGAAIIYLGLWAAARLYALVPPGIGIAGLAIVALVLAAVAYRLDIEALGVAAAMGALFAPIVVGSESADANALLTYVGLVGMTLGFVGMVRRWRIATDLVALTYFWLGLLAANHAAPGLVLAYALIGGCAGLALRSRWPEIGFAAFAGGWALLGGITGRTSTPWAVAAGAIVLATPIWWRALRSPTIWPDPAVVQSGERWLLAESLYFYLTPLLAGATIETLFPQWPAQHGGAIALLVALPYAVTGFTRVRVPFALAGTTAVALAALTEWNGLGATGTLIGLAMIWAGLDHVRRRTDGRWYSLLALAAALIHLLRFDVSQRGRGSAFVDPWALFLWLAIAVVLAMAMGLWYRASTAAATDDRARRREWRGSDLFQENFLDFGITLPPRIPGVLWTVAGALLFGGVTGEIKRLITQQNFSADVVQLASGLSVSAWWTVFAGGLVFFGFYRRLRPVRIAGLIVAGVALSKVVLHDLSRLDALYRVGSVFILAVVSLLMAYLYNRRAKSDESGTAP